MQTFTIPAAGFDEANIDKNMIRLLIDKHRSHNQRYQQLEDYYEGKHKISQDTGRENRLVCNHAKDIAETASSYFIGNPILYNSNDNIKILTDVLEDAGADEVDGDNGIDLSIYGRAYEYIYTKENETDLTIKNLSPKNTFIVLDDTIEENELFSVYYYVQRDDSNKTNTKYIATVLTQNYKWVLDIQNTTDQQITTENPVPHFKGEIPIIEYQNNKLALGDYELQIPLIDAYNALMSDRITDKEQFIDAILALYGTLLSDEDTEVDEQGAGDGEGSRAAMKRLQREKILELPDGTKAEYLTRTFDEAGVEILRRAIEQDIHKFSHIPCLSDEAFGGNVSGVAMEFKLLGMENITKIKTRYYRKGLRKRMRIFANWLQRTKHKSIDITGISPTFTRAMPKNLLEISQYVANLWNKVSQKTLLSQIPFVDDVEAEIEATAAEAEEAIKRQKALFGNDPNTPPDERGETLPDIKDNEDDEEE